MTDKLDILARLDAMSDDELFDRLISSYDYGLGDALGTTEDFLECRNVKLTYCLDGQRSLSFSITKKQVHATRMYHNINRIKEACASRLDFFNDQLPLCA
ncbi:hypothetical protein [Vibrio harveyi]|jgi:hypothetical protein|uniref:hypothetical protein n=1 Tax=Vibrio harveyi TaxID=669 RepID=UPI00390A9818